jgi:hypothetical protein
MIIQLKLLLTGIQADSEDLLKFVFELDKKTQTSKSLFSPMSNSFFLAFEKLQISYTQANSNNFLFQLPKSFLSNG